MGQQDRKSFMPRCVSLILIGVWLVAVLLTGPITQSQETQPPAQSFGLEKRVPWTSSRVVGSPDPPSPYRLERVFPKLKFKSPVCLVQEPGTNRMLVGENDGKIYTFSMDNPDADNPELFFDSRRSLYAF